MKRSRVWGTIGTALATAALIVSGPLAASALPTPVQGPTSGGTVVSDALAAKGFTGVAAGYIHNVALGSDGGVYTWGDNTDGQLGNGQAGPDSSRYTPGPVNAPGGVRFGAVGAGVAHSVALGQDGIVYSWGDNTYGQVGDGTTERRLSAVPAQMPEGVTFSAIGVGGHYTAAIASDGTAYAWGVNGRGQLGDGTTTSRIVPTAVQMPEGVTFTAVAPGYFHAAALGSDGGVYAWGANARGELGDGTISFERPAPGRVTTPAGVTFSQLAAGIDHTVALGSDGQMYAWGSNEYGQLGDGTGVHRSLPVVVPAPAGVTFTRVFAGGHSSGAWGSDGRLYTWGSNVSAQVGDGTTTERLSPVVTPTAPELEILTSDFSVDHQAALGSDGNVYVTGDLGESFTYFLTKVARGATAVTAVTFGGVPGTDLTYDGTTWAVTTPPGECGPVNVNVVVEYVELGQDYSFTYPNRFTYGSPVAITGQPASDTIRPGATFHTSVEATGDTAPSFQWQVLEDGEWVDLAEETQATLATVPDAATSYRVVVTNCFGAVVSDAASVEIATALTPVSPRPRPGALAATGADPMGGILVTAGLLAAGAVTLAASWVIRRRANV